MLIAEKGIDGRRPSSSKCQRVNKRCRLWAGKQASPYIPFVNFAPVVQGTKHFTAIFLTTVGVNGVLV